ncbi:hypothetical protein [Streptomyces sp. NA02950]|uniref:hypothetical protein n=1 Tax=Streptomyces sp. NA02950 TaxID=2742137 RepID=UPI0020CAC119|nr:hypothetical protein [Streptomyces sp. NA02950]
MSALLDSFRSEHAQRAFAEVRAESCAQNILRILKARGVDATPETRERIEACRDMEVLGTWLDRAATASRVEDLFT